MRDEKDIRLRRKGESERAESACRAPVPCCLAEASQSWLLCLGKCLAGVREGRSLTESQQWGGTCVQRPPLGGPTLSAYLSSSSQPHVFTPGLFLGGGNELVRKLGGEGGGCLLWKQRAEDQRQIQATALVGPWLSGRVPA